MPESTASTSVFLPTCKFNQLFLAAPFAVVTFGSFSSGENKKTRNHVILIFCDFTQRVDTTKFQPSDGHFVRSELATETSLVGPWRWEYCFVEFGRSAPAEHDERSNTIRLISLLMCDRCFSICDDGGRDGDSSGQ